MKQPAISTAPFLVKLLQCLLVAFAAWNIYHSVIMLWVSYQFKNTQVPFVMGLIGIAIFFTGLLFAFFYPVAWHLKEKKGMLRSNFQLTLFQTIIRYWLALMICIYAFAKILGTQFSPELLSNDSLAKDLSGFDLTWFYFSYSHSFSLTIALLQLTGAILLLFRKTVLAGVLILLPVMLNIVLINIFYTLTTEAELNAVFYLLGLLTLLFNYWEAIKNFFSETSALISTFTAGNLFKYAIRVGIVFFSFFYIAYLSHSKEPGSALQGKWKVVSFIRGTDTLQSNAWLSDSTAWKYIYIQQKATVVLNPNPYMVEKSRAQKGKFEYDTASHSLHIFLGKDIKTGDHYDFDIVSSDASHMEWKGEHLGTQLRLSLLAENK